jgi:D-sedoheptulose 7-phosphate isomerase
MSFERSLSEHAQLVSAMQADPTLARTMSAAADACIRSLRSGGKILLAGNGGSAGDAQHMAGELVGRFAFDRPGLPALALTTDSSVLTAIGNDYGYETLFARQLQALGSRGDVFICYSTSGRSANILRGLAEARQRGLVCIGFTGNRGGPMREACDHLFEAPSDSTPRIQEAHLVLGHALCEILEQALFGADAS